MMPLRKGSRRIRYRLDRESISALWVSISLFGCRTHMTTWVRERIITPSIRACPPNASEGSSFSAAANAISNHEFHESYILLRVGFGYTCRPCLFMEISAVLQGTSRARFQGVRSFFIVYCITRSANSIVFSTFSSVASKRVISAFLSDFIDLTLPLNFFISALRAL